MGKNSKHKEFRDNQMYRRYQKWCVCLVVLYASAYTHCERGRVGKDMKDRKTMAIYAQNASRRLGRLQIEQINNH